MGPRNVIVNADETLADYYHQIMEQVDARYDHHSVKPFYMPADKMAEMGIYETQARELVRKQEEEKRRGKRR